MKKKLLIFLIIFSVLFIPIRGEKKSINELPQRYKKWLEEEVVYIISPLEKEVFLQLKTDRERELFIEAFWKHRDKTLGTPENEYKKEHYRRINYSNYHFGRAVAKPGWKTDRGRIYIILGEPRHIERFIGHSEIFNTEVWYYEGLIKFGLPPVFTLVFFQKGGTGEYVLYNPSQDGPQALMTNYWGSQIDYLTAFKALANIAPSLAKVSLTLIPGEQSVYTHGRPSLASELLIKNILNVPQKNLKDAYAEKFLQFKDIIEVEYSTNYIENDSSIKIIKDPVGIYFVHYVVELMKFSVQQYEEKYSTFLKVSGNVKDLEGKTIYQYERLLSIKLNERQLKNITYRPFDFYDMFPLLSGEYRLSILIKNEVSKEFTSLEKNITIPKEDSALRMSSLILGYKMHHVPSESKNIKPFKIRHNQIYCQPNKVFHPRDKLFLVFQILGLSSNLLQNGQLKFEFLKGNEPFSSLTKKVSEYRDKMNFKEEFSLQNFPPGYYQIRVTLFEDKQELLYKEETFEITSRSILPRPWVHSVTLPPADNPAYSSILGKQFYNKGEINKARIYFEDAYHKRPNSLENTLNLAKTYFIQKKYDKVKQLLSLFLESSEPNYEVYLLLGKCYQALGEFGKAIILYDKAISHFGIDISLLNSLGECYSRLGSKDEALAAWEKSIEIYPNQPDIKKKIEAIKR